jgi:hypothetical protein
MRKIQIIGIAFAAIFAFSMVSASGASAFTLWDECMEVTAGTGLFTNNNCNVEGSPKSWEWLEILTLTNVLSLATDLILLSLGVVNVAVLCEGLMHGSVGLNGESQVTELLTVGAGGGEPITLEKPVACTNIENCPEPLANPVNLPWKDQLVNAAGEDAAGDLLGPEGNGNPGWFVKCDGNGTENECTKEDTILLVENLLEELEVHLIFPLETDTEYLPLAACSNAFSNNGFVEGEVLIYIPNPSNEAEPGRGLRAM